MAQYLNYGAAVFAFAAAVLWFKSALLRLPRYLPVVLDLHTSPEFGGASGRGEVIGLSHLVDGLKAQSWWSAAAAICAGFAAILTGIGAVFCNSCG